MKRKSIMIFVVLFLICCLAHLYFKYAYGWMEFRKNTDTPKEFLNQAIIKKEDYTKDSVEVVNRLQTLLLDRKDFFHDKAYFDSTQLIIDSIVYNPDFNKLAVFVIAKNPTKRQLVPDKKYDWYYDATCYLGIRQADTISLDWLGPVYTNAPSQESISNDIREACFRTFATKDTAGMHAYKYNLNDKRFWDSSVWQEMENKKLKQKAFEEEKKKHPENVYEPKK